MFAPDAQAVGGKEVVALALVRGSLCAECFATVHAAPFAALKASAISSGV